MIVEISKQVAALAGITSVAAMRSQFQQTGQGQGFARGDLEVSETDQAYRVTARVSHQPMNDPTGFNASVVGGNQLSWSLRMGDPSTPATTDLLGIGDTQLGNIDLTLHFPGKIISTSGPGISQPDDRSVRIQSPLTGNMNGAWKVTSAIDPAPTGGPILLIVLVGVVLVAAGLGAWRLLRRRPTPGVPDDASDASDASDAAAPAQPEATWPSSGSNWPDR